MKILVICQYYWPEPFHITRICEELAQKGHEVFVITGLPNYPMGIIEPAYRKGKRRDEVLNGVRIHRCFTIGRKKGKLFRFFNYYSYALSSTVYASSLQEEFDVVFVNQLSPVLMARAGIQYKKQYYKKLVLYCLDIWPESLIAGGSKRNSILFRHFHTVSKNIYGQADRILVTSNMFKEYFINVFGLEENRIAYLPQYAEDVFLQVPNQRINPKSTVDLVFAGNIGAAQSMQTIIQAAKLLADIPQLRWHIVGDGSALEQCKRLAMDLQVTSVIFHGRKPVEEMPKYYAMADAMLVTLVDDPVLSMTLPGKVQSYMAAAKPIIGAINGEAKMVIEAAKCGLCGPAENAEVLAFNVRRMLLDNQFSQYGINGQRYYLEYFSKNKFFASLLKNL